MSQVEMLTTKVSKEDFYSKRCFLVEVKFITEDSNAIHTIFTPM